MIQKAMIHAAALALATGAAGAQEFALNYGVAVTSNYISDGATQSNDNPALQGYVEGAVRPVLRRVWSSTVDFADDPEFGGDQIEFDLYAGVRPTLGDFSFDISYYRYLYDDSGDCCGEFVLSPVSGGRLRRGRRRVRLRPGQRHPLGRACRGADVPEVWEVGGAVGTDWGSEEWGEDDKVAWDAGVTRGLSDIASVDLRYYDSNYDPGTAVLTIYLDF